MRVIRSHLVDSLEDSIEGLPDSQPLEFNVNDLVRIRVEPKPGKPKRAQTRWSEEKYRVVECHPSHNLVTLQKMIETKDGRLRPNRFMFAVDKLRKITDIVELTSRKETKSSSKPKDVHKKEENKGNPSKLGKRVTFDTDIRKKAGDEKADNPPQARYNLRSRRT